MVVQGTRMISAGGDVVDVTMRIPKDSWRWEPKEVVIPVNKSVRLRIYNEDTYEHGISIKSLNIKQVIPPQAETNVLIPPTSAGEYPFRCSVWCGEGHTEQSGILVVK